MIAQHQEVLSFLKQKPQFKQYQDLLREIPKILYAYIFKQVPDELIYIILSYAYPLFSHTNFYQLQTGNLVFIKHQTKHPYIFENNSEIHLAQKDQFMIGNQYPFLKYVKVKSSWEGVLHQFFNLPDQIKLLSFLTIEDKSTKIILGNSQDVSAIHSIINDKEYHLLDGLMNKDILKIEYFNVACQRMKNIYIVESSNFSQDQINFEIKNKNGKGWTIQCSQLLWKKTQKLKDDAIVRKQFFNNFYLCKQNLFIPINIFPFESQYLSLKMDCHSFS